jgi:uncharacterized cofD-like protein
VVDTASFILKTKGRVIPVTFNKVHLCVEYEDGEVIETEGKIDTASYKNSKIKKAYLRPKAKANKKAVEAIRQASYIIIGPGDLYTTLIPNLIVDGISKIIKKSKGKIINIMNLMTKRGQTTNYKASDHIKDSEKYLGRKIDLIMLNKTSIPPTILSYYQHFKEKTVEDDLLNKRKTIHLDLISKTVYNKPKADRLFRSLLRHDPEKVGLAIWKIIKSY